jgi:1-acyl-sn-glycerol-3-phosphate acyltransferase
MSNGCCVPEMPALANRTAPSPLSRGAGIVAITPSVQRAIRLARLIVVLLGLWCAARARASRATRVCSPLGVRRWALRLLRALHVEVRASGHVPAPDDALLLVANHVSWLDSYAINTVNAARFVAKSEVRGWPVVGTIAARFRTLFLKRGCPRAAARVVAELDRALRAGQPVAAFPEGTTSDGSGLLRFYPAMFQSAVLSGARVQPVAIRYRGADLLPTQAAAFVGDMSVLDSVRRVLREPRLTAELVFCAPLDPEGRTRRQLAALARAAIAAALGGGGVREPTVLPRAA